MIMRSTPLSPDAKRLRTIIISLPILIATSVILYRRAYLGEEQRRIPQDAMTDTNHGKIAGQIGSAPWEARDQRA